jgi:hypothetical protein
MTHGTPKPELPRPLDCEEWLTLLPEALEQALPEADLAAFEAHRASCPACSETYREARQGGEWLDFLRTAPEPPPDLADRILARTPVAELPGAQPVLAGTATVRPAWYGRPWATVERHSAEYRLLMTVAMAFFSIAFTLNLAGVRLRDLHLSDLAPSTLAASVSRSYYAASAHVMRYYENLRFVYEVESRVNELRRSASTPQRETGKPSPSAQNGERKTGPSGGGAALTPARGRTHAVAPSPTSPAVLEAPLWGEPVPASFRMEPARPSRELYPNATVRPRIKSTCKKEKTKETRVERSLA